MKILVTGSLGTVGSPLVKKLRELNYNVFECDLVHSNRQNYKRVDIREYRQVEDLFNDDFDIVYHLAAEFGRINGENHYENLWKTNVIGTRHILEMQKKKKFKLIFSSSSEIYGDTNVDFMTENIFDNLAIEHHNDYSITKYVNEKQIKRFSKHFGTEYIILRFFNCFGPGEFYHPFRSVVCLFCYNAIMGLPIDVYSGGFRDYMYIDDLIETLSGLVNSNVSNDTFNIGGNDYRSVNELCDLVFSTIGIQKKNITYHDIEPANVLAKRPDIQKAIKLLGHTPKVQLEEGLKNTISWMKKVYK